LYSVSILQFLSLIRPCLPGCCRWRPRPRRLIWPYAWRSLAREQAAEIARLEARGAELETENTRLRERLGPHGLVVVMVDGVGHYVNEAVAAEIDRLPARIAEIQNAAESVLEASDDFHGAMGQEWEGDPLTDACDELRTVLAKEDRT
jgi:hypothetical protein